VRHDGGGNRRLARRPRCRAVARLATVAVVLLVAGCSGTAAPTDVSGRDVAPAIIAALGDSITRGYGLCDGWGDCPQASWATGTRPEVASHFARLSGADARAPRVHNLAVSGATVATLDAQARQAVATRADYVTVLIGGNDACAASEQAMTPTQRFAERFDAAMGTLTRGLPEAKILVVSIPDLHRLWLVGKDDERAVETWKQMGVCQAMLANPTSTAPEDRRRRGRVRDRVAAYNDVMATLCARHEQCRWDGHAVFEHPFALDAVSPRDFWHPSVVGQRRLAEVAWKAGFFD
jgi:hypothetical protein